MLLVCACRLAPWLDQEGKQPFVTKPVSFHNGSQVMIGHGNGGVLALNGTTGHKVGNCTCLVCSLGLDGGPMPRYDHKEGGTCSARSITQDLSWHHPCLSFASFPSPPPPFDPWCLTLLPRCGRWRAVTPW